MNSPARRNLRRQVAELLVLRASGHLSDQQRRYPQWELPNSTLQRLLQEGVGGVILLGEAPWNCSSEPSNCRGGVASGCCSAQTWRRAWANASRAPAGWCRPWHLDASTGATPNWQWH